MVSLPPKLVSKVDVRRADQRMHTELDWLDSRHSFSFGRHYDPSSWTSTASWARSTPDRVRWEMAARLVG